jgi:hypothetical protein
MIKVHSTSYKTEEVQDFITSFVKVVNPQTAIEIGTQQGMSAILIGRGMKEGSNLYCYDLFQPTYPDPPYAETFADIKTTINNIEEANLLCNIHVKQGSHEDAFNNEIDIHGVGYAGADLLHVDICNHMDNIRPILNKLSDFIGKAIILEGGIFNNWQKKYGFASFEPLLRQPWIAEKWSYIVVPFNEHNSVTFMTRR